MFKKDIIAVIIGSLYLVVYCELLQFKAFEDAAMVLLLLSPVVIIWMVYSVLRHGRYSGRELGRDEFGYADKNNDFGVF